MNRRGMAFLLALLLLSQTGCAALVAGVAVATGAVVALQERSVGDVIDDAAVSIRIHKELFKQRMFYSVDVQVSEGRVLLTGSVKTPEERIRAEKIAWQQNDVREVANEIGVDKGAAFKEFAIDAAISAQVRARMVALGGVKSINYSVHTVGGVVYLMGIAQNQRELNNVVAIARKIRGVKQVVSYVRLKHSELRR